MSIEPGCRLCPRACGADRGAGKTGYCGAGGRVRIARADLHLWEEPCLSGTKGAGTVFFSGCQLKCCYCQNYQISAQGMGFELTEEELAETFLMLRDRGAHNIDLVSPTPYIPQICRVLDSLGDSLGIPVVVNSGGYETVETVKMLEGRADIFLPDLKYYSPELSGSYSSAPDYFERAGEAIRQMAAQTGKPVFDENGIMKRGVIVRHLVLPGCRHDSEKLIEWLCDTFERDEILVSLMSQYVPCYKAAEDKRLGRRTSTFEYEYVADLVRESGFEGYFQKRESSVKSFIPEFYDKKYY